MLNQFRVIIAGSRSLQYKSTGVRQHLFGKLDKLLIAKRIGQEIVIISGTARGADQFGELYARARGFKIERYPADWDTHGKSAGYKRNVQMAEQAQALIALWDGKSKGTQHMLNIAKERGIPTRVIRYPQDSTDYEVSSKGDRRFSAFYARLNDGRTIEQAYQSAKGTGKGRPAKDPNFAYWETYKGLWDQWADENPALLAELAVIAKTRTLVDSFARTENNQARALSVIIQERNPQPQS